MALAILIGIVAAWPGVPSSGAPSRTWFDVLSFGVRVDGLSLAVVVIPVVAAVLSGADGDRWTAPNLPNVRALAWAVVFIAVTSALSFTAPLTPWCAALGAGVAIFLLPAADLQVATDLLKMDAAEHRRLVTHEIKIGNAQRIVNDSRKGLRTKVADGSMPYTEAQRKLRPIERDAKLGTPLAVRTESRRHAFGIVASMTPGEAGLCGARWGLLFGLPWMVLSVTAALYVTRAPDYPALQTLAAALPLILQWPVWGFVTYYFFPILRGATGLNKSLWLMTGVFLVSTLNTVLSGQQNLQWATSAVSAAQFYSFGVLLGLRADLEPRKRYGRTRSELPDVHNLGTAAGVASTIAVATVTAAAAAILAGGIQPFVQQLIPITPVSQPSQTVQSNGTSQSTAAPSSQPTVPSPPG